MRISGYTWISYLMCWLFTTMLVFQEHQSNRQVILNVPYFPLCIDLCHQASINPLMQKKPMSPDQCKMCALLVSWPSKVRNRPNKTVCLIALLCDEKSCNLEYWYLMETIIISSQRIYKRIWSRIWNASCASYTLFINLPSVITISQFISPGSLPIFRLYDCT